MCRLSVILNDLMHGIYSSTIRSRRDQDESDRHGTSKSASDTPFIRISRDIQEWWVSLPSYLRIPRDQLPDLAPPSHIVSLNVLYHTARILLHRPFVIGSQNMSQPAAQKSYAICIEATRAIHDLLILQANTFGFSHITYLNSYGAYIAATIAVLRFEREHKPGEDCNQKTQNLGLNFLLEVLQGTAMSMPALERSVAIIRKRMKAVLDRQAKNQLQTLFPRTATHPTPFDTVTPQQQELSQPTAFQHLSNAYPSHEQVPTSGYPNTQSVPIPWQSNVRTSLYSEPSFQDDYLPAFPGQSFPVGSEHSFGSDGMADPQARQALLGFNLDPHPRLDHGDLDWSFAEAFSNEAQMS